MGHSGRALHADNVVSTEAEENNPEEGKAGTETQEPEKTTQGRRNLKVARDWSWTGTRSYKVLEATTELGVYLEGNRQPGMGRHL